MRAGMAVAAKVAVALLFVSAGAIAQTDTLTLVRALETARNNNLSLRISQSALRQSESRVNELKASRLPPLQFHTHFLHAPESGYSEVVTNGGEYGVQLTSSVPLYDGGAKGALIDQSQSMVERSSLGAKKSEVEVAYAVRVAYYENLRAAGDLQIREETVERLEFYATLLDRLRLGGTATASDVLKADVDLNNARIERELTHQELKKSTLALAHAMGISPGSWTAVDSDVDADSTLASGATLEANYEIRMLESEKASTLYDISIARAERLPTVSIAGDVGALGVQTSAFHEDIGYSLFLSLDLPLFNWGAIGDRIEQKELASQQLEAEAQLRRKEIETEWTLTKSDLDAMSKALAAYSDNITRAEDNFLTAKSHFAGGAGSNLEVLEAQRLLTEAKLNRSGAQFQIRVDRAALLRLAGSR